MNGRPLGRENTGAVAVTPAIRMPWHRPVTHCFVFWAFVALAIAGTGVAHGLATAEPLSWRSDFEPLGSPATGPALEQQTLEVARQLRCPVCQGLSVADSPTDSAVAMREEVRRLSAAGYTPRQVLDHFERSYGEFILLQPKAKGLNWLVWLSPGLLMLAGIAIVVRRLRGPIYQPLSQEEAK